jgi:integrase
MRIRIRRSKTDQEGKGRTIGIPYASERACCPVWTLRDLLVLRSEGPVFISSGGKRLRTNAVSRLVARMARRAGLGDRGWSSHSLRSGLVTAAAAAGKSTDAIARQTGHQSIEVLMTYIRDVDVLGDSNAVQGLL